MEDRNEGLFRCFTSEFSLQEKLGELKSIQYIPRLLTQLNEAKPLNDSLSIESKLQKKLSAEDIFTIKDTVTSLKTKKSKFFENPITIAMNSKDENIFREERFTSKKEENDKETLSLGNQLRSSRAKGTLFSMQKSNTNSRYKDEVPKLIIGCVSGCAAFLVCDDDHFNIKVLQNFLQVYGLPIETAYHGDNAIEKVKNRWKRKACCRSFKLIFMDIEMPQKNGLEAAQEIILFWKEKGEVGCPIVATTGHVEEDEGKKILQSGMNEKISKPINHRDLRELVERLLVK